MRTLRLISVVICAAVLLTAVPKSAYAAGGNNQGGNNNNQGQTGNRVPEISNAGVTGVVTLLVGGTALLMARRRRSA